MLRSLARAALTCLVLVSGVANAYCSVDQGLSPRDDSCVASDTLSTLQVSEHASPGDVAAQAAHVLTFRGRNLELEPTPFLKSFNHPPLRCEPVFRRVPRLLI